MDEWEPQPGERVFVLARGTEGLHPKTPFSGPGTFVRLLGDHERFPYLVRLRVSEGLVDEYQEFTYARDELSPVNDGRN